MRASRNTIVRGNISGIGCSTVIRLALAMLVICEAQKKSPMLSPKQTPAGGCPPKQRPRELPSQSPR